MSMSSQQQQHVAASVNQKTLHDLQMEIKSFGPGPFTPEQQQKIHHVLVQKKNMEENAVQYLNRAQITRSSPSPSSIQVQTNATGQQVAMSTANVHPSVLPPGAVLMQPQMANLQSQCPSKVTIINNNRQGSSSLSQLSLLAQHPQGHSTAAGGQVHIKPSAPTIVSKPASTTIQRQVLPVHTLPAGHNTPVRMVAASIQGHQAGHILTPINIQSSPKHTTSQRPIAPHGISVQQTATPQGTPVVIQVSAGPGAQPKPTLVAATAVRGSTTPATIIPQTTGSSETLKAPITAGPKATSSVSQGLHSSEPANSEPQKVLSRKRIQELLQEIDPRATLDEEVEELLLQIADDFIESVVSASCQLAKHRKSNVLDVQDIQLHLERNWNMWIPGYGTEDFKQSKKLGSTEAHKQRLALIRKSMKK